MGGRFLDHDLFAGLCTTVAFGFVMVFALATVASTDTVGAVSGAEQSRTSGTIPVFLITVVIVESLVLVGLYLIYQRLPEALQRVIRAAVKIGVVGTVAYFFYVLYGPVGLAASIGMFGGLLVIAKLDLYWHAQNIVALGLAAVMAVLIGTIVGVWWLIGLLVALLIWDYVAVSETNIMQTLVEVVSKTGIPAYVVFAQGIRLDDDALEDGILGEDDIPDHVSGILGTGDLMFPTAFVVSVAIAVREAGGVLTSPLVMVPILGIVLAGVGMWIHKAEDEAAPGLPYLNGAAIVGFGLAFALNGGVFA